MADQKKLKVHKLQIRNKPEEAGTLSKGANMEVLLDGTPLRGVSFFKFEVKSGSVAKVMLEMFADVDIEAAVHLSHKELKKTGMSVVRDGEKKAFSVYEIGSYFPKDIVQKEEPMGCSSAGEKPYCDSCGCGKKAAYERKNK
jgi:hypothetical protein